MDVQLLHRPGNTAAKVVLAAGERCTTEGGSMIAMSADMRIETSTHARGGGILKAAKRLLAGESFFLNHYTAGHAGGELYLSTSLAGDMHVLELGNQTMVVQAGSFVAAEPSVKMDIGWQGFKTMFSGERMFWLKITGPGKVVLGTFGAVYAVPIADAHIVDTGHIVAFDETLTFKISKAGKSWMSSILGGEGLVCRFEGQGTVWCQSHNAGAFGRTIGPKLKPR